MPGHLKQFTLSVWSRTVGLPERGGQGYGFINCSLDSQYPTQIYSDVCQELSCLNRFRSYESVVWGKANLELATGVNGTAVTILSASTGVAELPSKLLPWLLDRSCRNNSILDGLVRNQMKYWLIHSRISFLHSFIHLFAFYSPTFIFYLFMMIYFILRNILQTCRWPRALRSEESRQSLGHPRPPTGFWRASSLTTAAEPGMSELDLICSLKDSKRSPRLPVIKGK